MSLGFFGSQSRLAGTWHESGSDLSSNEESDDERDTDLDIVHYERSEQSQTTRNRLLEQLSGRAYNGNGSPNSRLQPPSDSGGAIGGRKSPSQDVDPPEAQFGFASNDNNGTNNNDDLLNISANSTHQVDRRPAHGPQRPQQQHQRGRLDLHGCQADDPPWNSASAAATATAQISGGLDLVSAFLSDAALVNPSNIAHRSGRTAKSQNPKRQRRMHAITRKSGLKRGSGGSNNISANPSLEPSSLSFLPSAEGQAHKSTGSFSIGSIDLSLFGVESDSESGATKRSPCMPKNKQPSTRRRRMSPESDIYQRGRASPRRAQHSIAAIPRAGDAARVIGPVVGTVPGGADALSQLIPAGQKPTQLPRQK
eukprot:SAG31_NODE_5541_length_2468_cov_1.682566_2_plen_367_part_00